MSEHIRVISSPDFIRLDADGHFDLLSTRKMLLDTMWACVNSRVGRVLLDVRDATAELTTAQVLSLAHVCQEVSPPGETHKIAILNRLRDGVDRATIVAECASEHGWNIRAFRGFEETFEWLATDTDPDPCADEFESHGMRPMVIPALSLPTDRA